MIIAMTGTTGNMGKEALLQVMELDCVDKVRVLLTPKKKNDKIAKKYVRKYGKRIEIVRGGFRDTAECRQLIARFVEGVDYVVHMAAMIPPTADHYPKACYETNARGTAILVDAIKACAPQPKFVHTSTMALYGHRDEKHPWGRVGDPLMPSPFDRYASSKLAGERYVLEAGLDSWVVLRQSAMLHNNMMKDNLKDGLMYHTVFNTPLEWVSARDSGYLIKRIIERDSKGEVPTFWKNIYNIGAGASNRKTGYETFLEGFAIIGGSPEKFFQPNWFARRNFHGSWFYDADELESFFAYQRDTTAVYWKEIAKKHWYYAFGKIVPAKLISKMMLKPLLKDDNAPMYWLNDGQTGRVIAYMGSVEAAKNASTSWEDVWLYCKKDGYEQEKSPAWAKENGMLLSHGFDDTKPMSEWTIEDARAAAQFRGGRLLSKTMGSIFTPLEWECCEGHVFTASAFTVMRGGHWCDQCAPGAWNYDALAKKMPYYAQVWYDTHARDEDNLYYFDENYAPQYEPLKKD